ncbi:MAG TPA: biotin--[acetyl-CoA-carboxylase] ligase [Planctomycetota bacterium]|nr:biotin--[acetyl-CoA-carboxylase] ligase [Planctomycetota bacterium]
MRVASLLRRRRKPAALLFADAAEAVRWAGLLPPPAAGRAWLGYFAETGSTQDEAFRAAARGAVSGSAFVAEHQSAGRGRRASEWTASPGSSLLLSVLIRPAPEPARCGCLALAAAAAAAEAVERAAPGAEIRIKWPNDLFLDGRKLGGLLVEVRRGVAVLGLGLNVNQASGDFSPELRGRAVSLTSAGVTVDRRRLLAEVLCSLGAMLRPGRPVPVGWERLRASAERRLAWRGQPVRVTGCPGGALAGRLAGLAENGGLVVETAPGARAVVSAGRLEQA